MSKEEFIGTYNETMGSIKEDFGDFLIRSGESIKKDGKAQKEKGRRQKQEAYEQYDRQKESNVAFNSVERKKSPQRLKPTVLILFIKADAANTLIDAIKQKEALYIGVEKELFVNAMKMWVGTDAQYAHSSVKVEFERTANMDSFAKEYDYVVMKFQLNKEYRGYEKGADSMTGINSLRTFAKIMFHSYNAAEGCLSMITPRQKHTMFTN